MKTFAKSIPLLTLFFLNVILFSCSDSISKDEHDEQMGTVRWNLEMKKDSMERFYISALDEIDANLDAIRDHQGYIQMGPGSNLDAGISKKDQILNNISMINKLLGENRKKIKSLEKSLRSYKLGKKELIASIERAEARIAERETEIAGLKQLLAEKDFKLAELNKVVEQRDVELKDLTRINKEQQVKLQKVYYVAGTYNQLKEKKVLNKEGGLLGINRTKVLNRNLNRAVFTELDQYQHTTIALTGKRPTLISSHPDGSYSIDQKKDEPAQLVIKNPEDFWSVSKFLVVEVH